MGCRGLISTAAFLQLPDHVMHRTFTEESHVFSSMGQPVFARRILKRAGIDRNPHLYVFASVIPEIGLQSVRQDFMGNMIEAVAQRTRLACGLVHRSLEDLCNI